MDERDRRRPREDRWSIESVRVQIGRSSVIRCASYLAPVDTYRVISEASGVPELAGLRATYVDEPGPIEGGEIEFDTNYALDARLSQIEQAVGQRCEVIRSREGREISKGGAVRSVTPMLRISLDGGRWE